MNLDNQELEATRRLNGVDKENKTELKIIDLMISKKVNNYIEQYRRYPKYLKLPLWISNSMKKTMKEMEHFNLDYNTELLFYRNLIVCETITIQQIEEIEVF